MPFFGYSTFKLEAQMKKPYTCTPLVNDQTWEQIRIQELERENAKLTDELSILESCVRVMKRLLKDAED